MTIGNYGQRERNGWRYQFASKSMRSAWTELFHKSANSGYDNTKAILVQLLMTNMTFSNSVLDDIISAYTAKCEAASEYPWNYYYVKYPVFRPGCHGKLSNTDVAAKPYLYSVMQTKSHWSPNTYVPYLKEADDVHLSRDSMGQQLVYPGCFITCENAAYLVHKSVEDGGMETLVIAQNEAGVDTEDRIIKLKTYIAGLQ
jgi:hypothetical protein